MAKLLTMPEIAANATHATIHTWLKKTGDNITAGECIAEIESDKALVELTIEEDMILGKVLVEAGQETEVGAPICVLLHSDDMGSNVDDLLIKSNAEPLSEDNFSNSDMDIISASDHSKRIFASPLARRIAKENGVDLYNITGSGPHGRIVKHDIMSVLSSVTAEESKSVTNDTLSEQYKKIPHSSMRKAIAKRLTESKSTIPHFYLKTSCRMEKLLILRQQINEVCENKISINDFIIKAVAMTLKSVPAMNISWTEDSIVYYQHADICIAVSTDGGLLTPVVWTADTKSLSQISNNIAELVKKARLGNLSPNEYKGGNFTVTNLGMYGVDEFAAIINPPQSAILAIGAVREQAIVDFNKVGVGSMMTCVLSVDHRAIDGALATEWLVTFKKLIENPLILLI